MIRACLTGLLLCALTAAAQDYEREKRWADEIVPGLVVGDAVWLPGPGGRTFLGLYTEAANVRVAVLLVHGIGVHPDHGVIGVLRASLADAGFSTLSIQMPVLGSEALPSDYRPAAFAEAVGRIRAAGQWLRDKGAGQIVLVSHSLGSAMSGAYYEQAADSPFSAWVCMGLGGPFGSVRNVRGPILDVYGEKDLPGVLRADWRRRMTVESRPGSQQAMIVGADHYYAGRERQLVQVIEGFIRDQMQK